MFGEMRRNYIFAAFIAAFFYMLSYASAYEFSACPDAAQVDSAWWNPAACEGGMYSFGSLYFEWMNAPFTNETEEVTSVSLMVRTKSRGTDMDIQVWNGNSWSSLPGGRIDFLGNYVYDLTRLLPGPYMDGSQRIRIRNMGTQEMRIENLRLVVDYSGKLRTLTVIVKNCESDDSIEEAEVTVDGETAETGSDGMAEFPLPKGDVYKVEVSDGNYQKTSANVYLDDDKEVELCTRKMDVAGVDIFDLEAEDDMVSFYVSNTGNFGDDVNYAVYVNDDAVTENHAYLTGGDEEMIAIGYEFAPGRNKVKVVASLRDKEDSESVSNCVAGDTENYACTGRNVVREVIRHECASTWEVVETCEEGCSKGSCTYGGQVLDTSEGSCKAQLSSLDFDDNIPANELETLSAKVRNVGSGTRSFELRLFVDGAQKDMKSIKVQEGTSETATFQFRLAAAGQHEARIEAFACRKLSDTVRQAINVKSPQSFIPPVSPPTNPETPTAPPPVQPGNELSIDASPQNIETKPCTGSAVKVDVRSPVDASYNVEVTGMDKEFVDYPSSVAVNRGTGSFYLYVKSPTQEGNYSLRVRVSKGSLSDESEIKLVVSSNAAAGTAGGAAGSVLTGFISFAQSEWMAFLLIGILVLAVFIAFFMRYLFPTQQNKWDRYDFALLEDEYSRNVKRVALS